MERNIIDLFSCEVSLNRNLISFKTAASKLEENQQQTKEIFSEKWAVADDTNNLNSVFEFQKEWFLKLYGFDTETQLKQFLTDKHVILDAGCGLGYKAAWFAQLAPHAIVIGVDISNAALIAAKKFSNIENVYFLQADIASTCINDGVVDFTVCDQVIMHTEKPETTFNHLSEITSDVGEFACYVYSKKALPRELIDDFFRKETKSISFQEMWNFSSQLTELGRTLSNLNVKFECPDIPLLGIKGGEYDIQRFIYWNFIKCFWKEDWGFELSKNTNFDWYAPSNARRFSKSEFLKMADDANVVPTFFHEEEACYTGRFVRK